MGGFHENTRFPDAIAYESISRVGFDVSVVKRRAGRPETRILRGESAIHEYDVSQGIKTYADLTQVMAFAYAREGASFGFRFKDFLDFHSNPVDSSFKSTKDTRDQVLSSSMNGTDTTVQLVKRYTDGGVEHVRVIEKPVAGSVQIWFDGVLKTEGADYTVDTTTGVITFSSAPAEGVVVEASFEFDVPVRFPEGVQNSLEVNLRSFGAGQLEPIILSEVFQDTPGHRADVPGGQTTSKTISGNFVVNASTKVWAIQASTTSLNVSLPDPSNFQYGSDHWRILNVGSNAFTVKDHEGTTLVSLSADQGCEIILIPNASSEKVWAALS